MSQSKKEPVDEDDLLGDFFSSVNEDILVFKQFCLEKHETFEDVSK